MPVLVRIDDPCCKEACRRSTVTPIPWSKHLWWTRRLCLGNREVVQTIRFVLAMRNETVGTRWEHEGELSRLSGMVRGWLRTVSPVPMVTVAVARRLRNENDSFARPNQLVLLDKSTSDRESRIVDCSDWPDGCGPTFCNPSLPCPVTICSTIHIARRRYCRTSFGMIVMCVTRPPVTF